MIPRNAWLSLLPLAAAPALAQSIRPIVIEGDNITGVGAVTSINHLTIASEGVWLVEADTDHANTDADSVVLGPEGMVLREGQLLNEPVGATLDSFDSISFNSLGATGHNFFLDGTSGTNDDSGVYLGTKLLIQESDISAAPELSPGTPYIGFFEVRNGRGQMLVLATVDDVAIPSTVDQVLMRLQIASNGNLVGEQVIAKEGDLLPGQSEPIQTFGTGPHNLAWIESGDVMFFADLTGNSATDGVIYLGTQLLAQEGSPSPVAGRNWSTLSSPELDVSGLHQVYSGSLEGDSSSNLLIVKDGSKFVQEGDVLADFSPHALTSFGSGPLCLSNFGDLLWYGDWDDPDTSRDSGLFVNDRLVVQEGVSTVGGVVIDTLRGVQDGYAISFDGQHVLFEAILNDGTEGAFLLDLGLGTNYCIAAPSAQIGVPATIAASGSGDVDETLTLFASVVPVQPGIFFFGTTQVQVPFGNGFRCAGGAIVRLNVVFSGSGLATMDLDPTAVGITPGAYNFQYWYRDIGGGSNFNLSDGLNVVFVP